MTTYQWFIKPQDQITNTILANELPELNFIRDLTDNTGKIHNLWRCEYWLVAYWLHSQKTAGLRFKVFNRRGNRGIIREWLFHKKKKIKIKK